MKSKIISLFLLTVFLSLSAISAADFTLSKSSLDFIEPDNSIEFSITPNNASILSSYSVTVPVIRDDSDNLIGIIVSGDLTDINSTSEINVSADVNYDELTVGNSYSGSLIITNTDDSADTMNLPISFISTFCKYGEVGGDLVISDFKVDNDDGDDNEWSPLDKITVEVEVSNDGDDKIRDVRVEIGLYNSDGKNLIKDMDDLDDEEIDLGSIKDGDDDTAIFTFTVPADFESETYRFVVKAYSDDLGEKEMCISHSSDLGNTYYETIDVERESDEENHIVVTNVRVTPDPSMCGEKLQLTAELFNIGDEDYEEQVKVTLQNRELGIDMERIIRGDFDQGDSETFDFELDIPQDADEKMYVLEFRTYYDYDEDDDVYEIVSEQRFAKTITVQGGCVDEEGEAQLIISAELDSETPEAIEGKQVVIKATLTNTGDAEETYTVTLSGNSAWSSLSSIDPQIVTLPAGTSKVVNIILTLDENSAGNQDFIIKTTSSKDKTVEQRVALNVIPEDEVDLGPFVEHLRNNWFIYLIVLINIILIIAIIAVVRRMVSPRAI
jgi:hypothetical protein